MADGQQQAGGRHVRTLFGVGSLGDMTDGQLLERFRAQGGEGAELAFAALVDRHGSMVLRTCGAVLRDSPDAHDAFQATFLLLVRRARSLWVGESLGPWLHQVARRTACHARVDAARRRRHERGAAERAPRAASGPAPDDLGEVIHEEIGRLPERYRAAVVLCLVEGLTHEQAARSLRWPVGTVQSRLARGRERLRARLTRRGVAPAALALVGAEAARAAVPVALAGATVRAGVRLGQGGDLAGVVSAAAERLTREVLRTMVLRRLWVASVAVPLAGALVLGVGGLGPSRVAVGQGPARADVPAKERPAPPVRDVLLEAARAAQAVPDPGERMSALLSIAQAQTWAGDKEGAVWSTAQATKAALAVNPGGRCRALTAVAWLRAGAGDRVGALDLLRTARQHADGIDAGWQRVGVLRSVAGSQLDLGDRHAYADTVRAMRDFVPPKGGGNRFARRISLSEVVGAMAYAGDFEDAFRTVEDAGAGDRYVQGGLYGAIAEAATADSASYPYRPRSFGPKERAARRRVLDRIEKAVEPFSFAEDKPPYVELAIATAKLGDFDEALGLARRFDKDPIERANGIDLTAGPCILSVIGSYQAKAGQLEKARETFREALHLIARDPKLAKCLGQVAEAQAEAGDYAAALKTVEGLDARQRPGVLSRAAENLDRSGDREGARTAARLALAEAERAGLGKLDARSKDDVLTETAFLRARLGEVEAATAAFQTITGEDNRGRVASAVARARAAAGDVRGALDWALRVDPPSARGSALSGLGTGTLAER